MSAILADKLTIRCEDRNLPLLVDNHSNQINVPISILLFRNFIYSFVPMFELGTKLTIFRVMSLVIKKTIIYPKVLCAYHPKFVSVFIRQSIEIYFPNT